jgi:hypothetical protein
MRALSRLSILNFSRWSTFHRISLRLDHSIMQSAEHQSHDFCPDSRSFDRSTRVGGKIKRNRENSNRLGCRRNPAPLCYGVQPIWHCGQRERRQQFLHCFGPHHGASSQLPMANGEVMNQFPQRASAQSRQRLFNCGIVNSLLP